MLFLSLTQTGVGNIVFSEVTSKVYVKTHKQKSAFQLAIVACRLPTTVRRLSVGNRCFTD